VKTADRDADIVENTRRCNVVFEEMLRRYPEQWIWFHKRWKTRPIGDPRIY
jgi:KDO2-lipid IV(A) lauroyltransferase